MLGGRQVTRYKQDAEQYDVIVQVGAGERRDPRDIRDIYVRARTGEMVPLTSVVQVSERAPRELNHFRPAPLGDHLGQPGARLRPWARRRSDGRHRGAHPAAPGYSTDYDGQSREFKTSARAFALVFCSRSPSSTWCWQRSLSFRDPSSSC